MRFIGNFARYQTKFGRSLAFALACTLLCPPAASLLPTALAQEVPASQPAVPASQPAVPASQPAVPASQPAVPASQPAVPASQPAAPAPPAAPAAGSTIRIPTVPVQTGPIRTILLFPFANAIPANGTSGGFSPEITGARVEDAIKMRLNVIGRYKANSFSPSLPQIQRALEESGVEGLTESDLTPPYNDSQKATKIAAQIGTDGFLLGTIESITSNPTTRNVSLTVSASLYNSTTGTTVKVLAATGHGVSYNAIDSPDNLLQSAINDVAGRVVSALNADAAKQTEALPPVDYVRGHKDNSGSILLGILLAAGIGLAISSSHHSSGGGSSTPTTGTGTGTGTGSPGVPNPPVLTGGSGGPPNPPTGG